MSKLLLNILDARRQQVWLKLGRLPRGGVLGGGTAPALQIGHRMSYDFDIFYEKPITKNALLTIRKVFGRELIRVLIDTPEELTVLLSGEIKLTLLSYPFSPLHKPKKGTNPIALFQLNDIASSKAYAIGRRGVWRDYVDVYMILRDHLPMDIIITESERRYKGVFDANLFLKQLSFFDGIEDFSLEYIEKSIPKSTIKSFLQKQAIVYLKKKYRLARCS